MATRRAPSDEPRLPLSRDRVLRAAIELADDVGIESLSMRRLGQSLGVEAMSLYNHVANKDDILNAIVDMVGEPDRAAVARRGLEGRAPEDGDVGPRPASSDTLGPRAWRCRRPASVRPLALHGRDPWRPPPGGLLADDDGPRLSPLESHVAGFTLWSSQLKVDDTGLADLAATFLRELPDDTTRPRRARPLAPEESAIPRTRGPSRSGWI